MKGQYLKVSTGAELDATVKNRIAKGELKWSHYAIDEEVGYHYYEVVKS